MSDHDRPVVYRLTFGRRIASDQLHGRDGEVAEGWIETDDPSRLKAYVAAGNWVADPPLRISALGGAGCRQTVAAVTCTPTEVDRWNPATAILPDGDAAAPRPSSPARARLSLLRTIRSAVAAAVAADVIGSDDEGMLLLAAKDAVDRRARLRRRTVAEGEHGEPT